MDNLQIKPTTTEEDRKELFEQYKLVLSSIDNSNQTRESLNSFWTSSHSIMLTVLAFVSNNAHLSDQQKSMIFWTVGIIGAFLCLSWIRALGTVIVSLQARNRILMKLESYFPANVFTSQMESDKGVSKTERATGGAES